MRRHHQNREKEYKVGVSLNVSFIRHILSQNHHKTKQYYLLAGRKFILSITLLFH